MKHVCTLRVYAEAEGPVVALILITHWRGSTDLSEIDLPYVLWQSMGTRAAASMIAQFYRRQHPDTFRALGTVAVQRSLVSLLQAHQGEYFGTQR